MLVLFHLESVVTPVRLCYLCLQVVCICHDYLGLHSDGFLIVVSIRLNPFAFRS